MAKSETGALRGASPIKGASVYGGRAKGASKSSAGLLEGNDGLGKTLLLIDPFKIVSWQHKDRQVQELEEDKTFHDMVAEFEAVGMNLQPIKVRPYKPKSEKERIPGIEFEEIFGFKRLMAAQRAKKQVLCIYEDIDDKEAFSQMVSENRGRSPLSAWTKAMSWNNALTNKLIDKASLAKKEGIDETTIDSYLRILEIMDDEIIERVSMHKLGIEALFEMRSALLEFENNAQARQRFVDLVIENADVIAAGKANKSLFVKLRADAAGGEGSGSKGTDNRVLKSGKHKLVTIKPTRTGYSVTMHSKAAKTLDIEQFEKAIQEELVKRGIKISE